MDSDHENRHSIRPFRVRELLVPYRIHHEKIAEHQKARQQVKARLSSLCARNGLNPGLAGGLE
jgi:hypothetical protein